MDIKFETLEELYKRIKPALITKKNEMHRDGYIYIKGLSLYDMTSDILNTDNIIIDNYLKEKLNLRNRNVYFDN